jgi:DNA-binding PadR family transcriptional regulator
LNEGKVEVKYTLSEKGREVLRKISENPEIVKILNECRSLKKKTNEIEKKLDEVLNKVNLNF